MEDIALDAARDQRVLDLQVTDRPDGRGAPDGLRSDLGEPDVPHIPGVDELADGADRLLDGHRGIQARRPIDVDVVGTEALQ